MLNEAPRRKSMEVQLQILCLYVTSCCTAHNQGDVLKDKHNCTVVFVC